MDLISQIEFKSRVIYAMLKLDQRYNPVAKLIKAQQLWIVILQSYILQLSGQQVALNETQTAFKAVFCLK